MNKILMIGIIGLLFISVMPLNSALTNFETARNTAILTAQIYNPINYPIAIDPALIQNKIIRFISFRDIVDYVLVGIKVWA